MKTTSNNLESAVRKPFAYSKCIRNGAIPALLLVSLFLITAGKSNPEWGAYWRLKPLLVVPFMGMLGGAIFAFVDQVAIRLQWNRTALLVLCVLAYIICIWLGFVLGFNGTYWN